MGFDVGFYDILEQAANAANVPVTHIGPAIGHGPGYVHTARARGSVPSVDNAARMLAACDYTLVAVPSDAVPDGALVIAAPASGASANRAALERKRAKLARDLADLDKRLG